MAAASARSSTAGIQGLCPRNAVIDKDALVDNNPTLRSGVRVAVLHLPGDGFLLVGDAGLLRALACVDGSDHRCLRTTPRLRICPISAPTSFAVQPGRFAL